MKVQGLVALITGGASGFGKGFASALLHKGARGVSLVDISDGKNIVDEFSDKFGSDRVLYHEADVTSDTDMENAFANTVEHFTGLDVVCNNAGILDESKWKKVVDVNLNAVIRGTFLAKKYMDKNSGGRGGLVINTSSLAGCSNMSVVALYVFEGTVVGQVCAVTTITRWFLPSLRFPSTLGILYLNFCPVYCGTKHGVMGFSKSLTMPGGDKAFDVNNIRINMVCPTFADTSLLRTFASQLSPDEYEEFKESVGVVPVSDVVAAYMRLVEEDLHGEAIRISIEKGIDLHKFRKQPKLHLSKF